MALDQIHLRKLLMLLFLSANMRRSRIRAEIRTDRARAAGLEPDGGDFYAPFWADARDHVFGLTDLRETTAQRIAVSAQRSNLYPRLRDGFFVWWNERRRWTNRPFTPGTPLKARFRFPGLEVTVKVDKILSVRDGAKTDHFVYPYFVPEPVLSQQAARWGLWLLIAALPDVHPAEIRILDVIRGQTFSIDRYPLLGNEEVEFRRRYVSLLAERDELLRDYD